MAPCCMLTMLTLLASCHLVTTLQRSFKSLGSIPCAQWPSAVHRNCYESDWLPRSRNSPKTYPKVPRCPNCTGYTVKNSMFWLTRKTMSSCWKCYIPAIPAIPLVPCRTTTIQCFKVVFHDAEPRLMSVDCLGTGTGRPPSTLPCCLFLVVMAMTRGRCWTNGNVIKNCQSVTCTMIMPWSKVIRFTYWVEEDGHTNISRNLNTQHTDFQCWMDCHTTYSRTMFTRWRTCLH